MVEKNWKKKKKREIYLKETKQTKDQISVKSQKPTKRQSQATQQTWEERKTKTKTNRVLMIILAIARV